MVSLRKVSLAAVLLAAASGCHKTPEAPAPAAGFSDDFDRSALGPAWFNTGGPYRLEGGALHFENAHNHPLWLTQPLPASAQIDFDISTTSPAGDLKVEVYGDGQSFESDDAVRRDLIYTASGYVFIFGGWHNARSVLVKQNEHAWQFERGIPMRTSPRVEPGRTYHWTIVRRGGHLAWSIDGQPFLSYDDPQPLSGPGHDRFGFDGWETDATIDHLRITPL